MGAPPVLEGATQVKTTYEEDVFMLSLVKAVGELGMLGIVAPFPADEVYEYPSGFCALTVAVIDDA
jgi:hypothetical protein